MHVKQTIVLMIQRFLGMMLILIVKVKIWICLSINSYDDMLNMFQVNFLDDNQDRRKSLYEKIGIYIGFKF